MSKSRSHKWSALRTNSAGPTLATLLVAVLYLAPLLVRAQSGTSLPILSNGQQQQAQQQPVELLETYPYYLQSPMVDIQKQQQQQQDGQEENHERPISRRTTIAGSPLLQQQKQQQQSQQQPLSAQVSYAPRDIDVSQPMSPSGAGSSSKCLYDKRYFARFDQCLDRKPYPTIGLPAFKNDDLLVRNGLTDKHGCSFILTNGLFKNYQITKYSIDSDTKCLDDNAQVQLSMQLSNVTLYYLWQLRCLNYANQLLDDATLDGKTLTSVDLLLADGKLAAGNKHNINSNIINNNNRQHQQNSHSPDTGTGPVCVGSSQNFGFTSLQLTNVEAQVELAIDIYKNWRITNITLAMLPGGTKLDIHAAAGGEQTSGDSFLGSSGTAGPTLDHQRPSTAIRDFTFETLDGDELNWRYLSLYENWTRNRLHSNFLDQFKRFVWVSLQRCLSESSDRLPVKLVELFGQQRYN